MNDEIIINNLLIFLRDRVTTTGTAEAEALIMCKSWLIQQKDKKKQNNLPLIPIKEK